MSRRLVLIVGVVIVLGVVLLVGGYWLAIVNSRPL